MSKPLIYAAITLAVALPFAAQAKTAKPASASAPPASAPASSDSATSSATTPPAAAAPPAATPPAATTPPAAAPTANAAAGAATDASATAPAFTVGAPVKDNTGAVIGSITELKPGATGAQTATIKMGADQFAVVTTGMALQDGAAVINMTQAELQAKLHPAAAPK